MGEIFRVGTDDACLAGHFPGQPIVPGVVILAAIERAVARHYGGRVTRIVRCKFMQALLPEQDCRVELCTAATSQRLRFVCHGPEGVVAQGSLEWEAEPHG